MRGFSWVFRDLQAEMKSCYQNIDKIVLFVDFCAGKTNEYNSITSSHKTLKHYKVKHLNKGEISGLNSTFEQHQSGKINATLTQFCEV